MTHQPPRYPCGHLNIPRAAARITIPIHQARFAMIDSASICADLHDLLPPRGDLKDRFLELVEQLAHIEQLLIHADDEITDIALLAPIEDNCHWTPDLDETP